MVCVSWTLAVVGLLVAAAAGFVVCFLWHWWLISRPGAR